MSSLYFDRLFITPHRLDYPDKSRKKMFASTPVGVALKQCNRLG